MSGTQRHQIPNGVQFITASANHRYDGISSYLFAIFGGGLKDGRPSLPTSGPDTTIGDDCWIRTDATLLSGTNLGNGVIVGAGAVVSGSIPDYAIVVSNPARVVKMRFDQAEITILKAIAWWDCSVTAILKLEAEISGADFDALQAV